MQRPRNLIKRSGAARIKKMAIKAMKPVPVKKKQNRKDKVAALLDAHVAALADST